jgi:hypothetical protein
MTEVKKKVFKPGLSLDLYAVALALLLAILVRFNLIPAVKW